MADVTADKPTTETTPLSLEGVRGWVRRLTALVADRAGSETAIEKRHRDESDAARREHEQTRQRLESDHAAATESAETEYREAESRIHSEFEHHDRRTRRAESVERATILEKGQHSETMARRKWDEAVWAAETVYEAKEDQPDKQYQQRGKDLKARLKALDRFEAQAKAVLRRARQKPPPPAAIEAVEDDRSFKDARQALDDCVADAAARRDELSGVFLLKLFSDIIPFVLAALPPGVAVVLVGLNRNSWQPDALMIGAAGAGLAGGAGRMIWL